MRKHAFLVVASSAWMLAATAFAQAPHHAASGDSAHGRGDVSTRAPPGAQAIGGVPVPAGFAENPGAWVLRVPPALEPPVSRHLALPAGLPRSGDEVSGYPDPRRMPIEQYRLELHLERDFDVGRVPLTSRAAAQEPDVAWQALDAQPVRTWQSDLVVRLPDDFYLGGSAEQLTTNQKSLFGVVGKRF